MNFLKIKIRLIIICLITSLQLFSQGPEGALVFDGADEYVDIGATGIPLTTNFTLEAWIYSDQSDANYNGIMGNQASSSTNRAPGLWIYQNTRIHYGFGNGTTWQSGSTPTNSIVEEQWNHIAMTYDSSPGEIKIYVNGVLIETKGSVTGTPVDPFRWIGRVDNYFEGQIDEVRVWSITRTETELRDKMCQKLTGSETNLEGYWRFDDGSGTTLTDETSAGEDGTLTNMESGSDWVTSAAAIGDDSGYTYTGSWSGETVDLTSVAKGNFQVNTVTGTPDGIHIYRVDATPNATTGITNTIGSNDVYYGVFIVEGSSPTYEVEYDYSSYTAAQAAEPNIELYNRTDNVASSWSSLTATLDGTGNTLTDGGNSGLNQEFLIGGVDSTDLLGYKGPGGVGNTDGDSGLVAWYYPKNMRDATNDLPTDGETVDTWLDASGYDNTATNTGTATYEDDGSSLINGIAVLNASALNRQFVTSGSVTGKTLIAVNDPGSRNSFEGVVGFDGDKGIRRPNTTDNLWQYPGGGDGTNNDTWSTDTGASYVNGSTTDVGTHSNTLHIISQERPTTYADDLYIGGYYSSRSFTGTISEIIAFDTDLNLAQKIIVDNYLAAKYDISLVTNDFYNEDDNGDFDYDVAGIGQATDGSNHTDSQGTGIVRINNPRGLGNDEYLFWGRNNQDAVSFETNTSVYKERLNTVWRASRRSNPGRVDITFDLSGVDMTAKQACADLELLVDNNSDFSSPDNTYTLTDIGGGFYCAENIRIRNNRYFTLQYQDLIVVDGTQFYNGSGASEVPDLSDDCYKLLVKNTADGLLPLTEDADVREVEIESGGKLVVNTGIRLQVTDGIDNSGDIRMIGTSQLLQTHTGSSSNTGTGDLYIDQQGTNSSVYRYNYWSSPVASGSGTYTVGGVMKDGTTVTSAASSPPNITFTTGYDGDDSTSPITISNYWIYKFTTGNWSQLLDTGVLGIGEGYTMKGPGAVQSYTFVGTPNDGDINISVTDEDAVLLGNPYPSALDADAFISLNSVTNGVIDGSIYFWEHNGEVNGTGENGHYKSGYQGGYSVRNLGGGVAAVAPSGIDGLGPSAGDVPGQYIAIGQGFFVNATATSNVEFKNSMRAFQVEDGSNSIFFKSKTKKLKSKELNEELPFFRLGFEQTNSQGTPMIRQLLVTFKEGMTNAYDNGYDSSIYDLQNKDVYWKFNNEDKFVIAGIESYQTSLEIPLEVTMDSQGIVSFATLEKNAITDKAYLYDKLMDIYYGLSNEVTLLLDSGVHENRFYLTFKENGNLSNNSFELEEKVKIYQDFSADNITVQIDPSITMSSIEMYSVLGEKLDFQLSSNKNSNEYNLSTSSMQSGIYIVRLISNKGALSKKILIRK